MSTEKLKHSASVKRSMTTRPFLHVEKANPDIRGIYAAINKEFAEHAWGDVVYLNREEDMGHEGLRTAKESYHPEFMIKKYSSVFK